VHTKFLLLFTRAHKHTLALALPASMCVYTHTCTQTDGTVQILPTTMLKAPSHTTPLPPSPPPFTHAPIQEKARILYTTVLKADPAHVLALDHKCSLLALMLEYEEAANLHKKVCQLDPAHTKKVCVCGVTCLCVRVCIA
jgi:hypothetical protein